MTATAILETPSTSLVREDDTRQHIEDTPRLFWIFRNGRNQKVSWNEMTAQERRYTIEAERRDYYNSLFNPCDL